MRTALKVTGICIALFLVIAAIPALIPDEEYSSGAEQWLKDANSPENLPNEVNRFNALAGFNVEADKDMVVEGAKLVAEINAQLSDSAKDKTEKRKLNAYWGNPPLIASKRLTSSTTAAFDKDPAQWLSDNRDEYNLLISRNHVLLDRFRKLMTMESYSYTMKLNINAPFIPYRDFLAIKRLNNLSIINDFMTANKHKAIKELQENISFSKLMMKQSVLLLEKMIATELLKIDLLTYSSLLDISPADNASKFQIQNLQKDERTMLNVIKGEFAFISTSLDMENVNTFDENIQEPGLIEKIIIKLYLKPKKLENYSYNNMWMPFLRMENQTLATRKIQAADIGENKASWWEIYQDPIGYVLLSIAIPSYFEYTDKIDHVDATITLLNLKTSIYMNKINPANVENYLSSSAAVMNDGYTGAKIIWNKDKHELSFDIPDYKNKRIPRVNLYRVRKK